MPNMERSFRGCFDRKCGGAIPGSYFVRTKYRFFALVLFRCRLRMQLFGAAARSCGRRAGSRIGRLRDSAVSRPRFRVCAVARAFGGGCRSAACSCRRRSQHIRSLRPRGAFSSPPAGCPDFFPLISAGSRSGSEPPRNSSSRAACFQESGGRARGCIAAG